MKKKSQPVTGKGLTRKDALALIKNYKDDFNPDGQGTIHVTFTAEEVKKFILETKKLKEGELIRFYLGAYDEKIVDEFGNRKATVVIVRALQYDDDSVVELTKTDNPRDLVALNFGTLCPPQCNLVDINSLSYEVYESDSKPVSTKRKKATGKKSSRSKR